MLEQIGPGTPVIPGHGPLNDEAELRDYHDLLTDVRNRVQALIDKGRSFQEVLAAAPTSDYDTTARPKRSCGCSTATSPAASSNARV